MDSSSGTPRNIVRHQGKLVEEARQAKLGQKGAVVWFTGLSGSGKSTIAHEVEFALVERGKNAFVLDGDNIRHGLNSDLGFSPQDRKENIRRIAEVANLFRMANVIALVAFISPYKDDRKRARALAPAGRFLEIYCDASIEVCEARDTKGLYRKARLGQIPEFTGISAPYEPPDEPELVLHTGEEEVAACVRKVLELLKHKDLV